MDQYTTPAVHQLDNGWQAPNPIDFQRAAQAEMQPINDAIAKGNEARNQFMLNDINNRKAMELAQWQHTSQLQLATAQHKMQIEREQMRDDRATHVAQLAAASKMDLMKQQGAFNDIKAANANLTSQLGGDPVARNDGEADASYLSRIQAATKAKLTENIKQDSLAKSAIDIKIGEQNAYRNSPQIQSAFQKMASDPTVQQSAQSMVTSGLSDWLGKVAPDRADAILAAMKSRPDSSNPQIQAAILKNAGLGQAFDDYRSQAIVSEAARIYPAFKPMADNMTAVKDNLSNLYRQRQQLDMMPSANGRMVEKPWASASENAASVHTALAKDPTAKISFDTDSRTWKVESSQAAKSVAAPAPTVAPTVTPTPTANPVMPPNQSGPPANNSYGGTLTPLPAQSPSDAWWAAQRGGDPVTAPAPAVPLPMPVAPANPSLNLPPPAAPVVQPNPMIAGFGPGGTQFNLNPPQQALSPAPVAAAPQNNIFAPPPNIGVVPSGAAISSAASQPIYIQQPAADNGTDPLSALSLQMQQNNAWRAMTGN